MSNLKQEPKNLTPIVETPELTTRQQAELKRKAMRDKEREVVKGVFKDYECPGGSLGFVFKKYKEDPIDRYDFVDGGVYTIPLGVARHINGNCWYPVHSYTVDSEGKQVQRVSEKIHRYGFSSLEFMDMDDSGYSNSQIVKVENIIR
jgi:hypothetical protein